MHAHPTSSNSVDSRRAKRAIPSCVVVFLASVATPANAMAAACQPTDSVFLCRLRSVLTFLDTAAVLLGILLILAVLAAVWAYRRKPRKLTPDDITPDTK